MTIIKTSDLTNQKKLLFAIIPIFSVAICLEMIVKWYFGFIRFQKTFNSDFFINYQSGFIRRGLDGEIVFFISKFVKCSPLIIFSGYYMLVISLTAFFLYRIFSNLKLPLYFIFSPFLFLGFLLYFPIYHVSKDPVIIFLFIIFAGTLSRSSNKIIINLILISGILIHEEFFLFSFFPYLLFKVNKFALKDLFMACLDILPAIACFLLMIGYFNGTNNNITLIYESWAEIDSRFTNKIKFNSGLFDHNYWYIWSVVNGRINYVGFLLNLIFNFMYITLGTLITGHYSRKTVLLFSLQHIPLILLCLFASDFYRWFLLCNITTIISLYFFAKNQQWEKAELIFPYKRIQYSLFILYLLSGLPYIGWNIYRYIFSNPLHIIISYFS